MREWRYYLPHYWPVWLLSGLFWLLIQLPFRWQLKLGKWLGLLIMRVASQSRHVADVNLRLCFPELTRQARLALQRKSFMNIGMAIFETGMGFWASDKRLAKLVQISGQEHVLKHLQKQRGVLLLGAHFTTLEIVGRICAEHYDFAVMYRPHKLKILNYFIQRVLNKHYTKAIPRNHMKSMVRTLQEGKAVWYSADVNPKRRQSIFAPFFTIPAATPKAPMRLAELTGCAVVPVAHYRRQDGRGYVVEVLPELENFPSGDYEHDAARINQLIETQIRRYPEQYLWQYMRFKTRPSGKRGLYKKDSEVLADELKQL